MKVRLYVKGWEGDHQVPLAESTLLLLTKIEFEGCEIDFSGRAYLDRDVLTANAKRLKESSDK